MNSRDNYRELIEGSASLKQLLQSKNMLPDQIYKSSKEWEMMMAIVRAYEIGWQAAALKMTYSDYFKKKKSNEYKRKDGIYEK